MVVITSFSQDLYKKYAHRVVETFKNWPEEARLIIYSEDMTGESSARIEWRDLNFQDLVKFKACCDPDVKSYVFDAARFANKVWAMVEGSMNETGLVFWLDADCVTYRKPSADLLRRLIPPLYYLACFQRPSYTETGFWGVRANQPEHKHFMTSLKEVYTSGQIFRLPQWHDCYALDYTIANLGIKAVNLTQTQNSGAGIHVIATSQLGKYIDHKKGSRKELGYSPENPWHKELVESRRGSVLGDGERSGDRTGS